MFVARFFEIRVPKLGMGILTRVYGANRGRNEGKDRKFQVHPGGWMVVDDGGRRKIWVLIVAFVDQLAITMSQQGLSILSEAFKQYAHLGIAQMGILFSTVALGAVVGMIPAGFALARYGLKTVAWVSGIAIVGIMGSLAWFLPRAFTPLIVLLGFVGFFLPALSLTGTTAITRIYGGSKDEGTAIGLRQAATPLGGIVAASVFPLLIKHWNLKTVLGLIAINVGLWRLLFAWVLPSRPQNNSDRIPPNVREFDCRPIRRRLLALKFPLLVSFLLSPGQYVLLTYAILDLHGRWRVALTVAGPVIALALLSGFVVRIVAGVLSDKGVPLLRLFQAVALTGIVSLVLWAVLPASLPFWGGLAVIGGLGAGLDGWNGLLTAWVAQMSTTTERGMTLGLIGMAGFIGIVLFLPVFGEIVRTFASYRPAWALLALVYLGGVAVIGRGLERK
ncbi:MAG: hypothetical protein C7B43_08555 [Sulfobacillus benefaciens]|uniref:Major facilitator superfamily (MFS) profile domain-containing protein n=1 Tax=Sulfobacillus benefaciens TaxID=453960 RepID=A0A2T2X4G6_9FIRM|nr:MAG: hypothetical protein C7B43_08555 [Sulfobacillus benefaciens]